MCQCVLKAERWADDVDLKAALFEYMEVYYNRKRRHSSLGYGSPAE